MKQKGKSSAESARYMPSADQPYSRESLRRRWEIERLESGDSVRLGVGDGVGGFV
jgi:hypothetical protein